MGLFSVNKRRKQITHFPFAVFLYNETIHLRKERWRLASDGNAREAGKHPLHGRVTLELLQAVSAMRESAQKNPRTIYECMSQAKCQTLDEQSMLIRLAILELLIPKIGGEWELSCTKDKGTEVTVDLVLDLADTDFPAIENIDSSAEGALQSS